MLAGLSSRHVFLIDVGAGKSKIKVPACVALGLQVATFSESSYGRESILSSSSYKTTNPIMRTSPSWPRLFLINFLSPYLQTITYWELGLQQFSQEKPLADDCTNECMLDLLFPLYIWQCKTSCVFQFSVSVPDLSGTYFLLFKEKNTLVLSSSTLVYDSVQKLHRECH